MLAKEVFKYVDLKKSTLFLFHHHLINISARQGCNGAFQGILHTVPVYFFCIFSSKCKNNNKDRERNMMK